MKKMVVKHQDLEVYRKAFETGMQIFELSKGFPKEETFSLTDQILLAFNTNTVLMCECTDLKSCHRFLLAEKLPQKGYSKEELLTWKMEQAKIN
jgi:hypothetical protein